ncbi:MAG: Hpt domain-containing protein [Phycisphaerales bacterium]
MAADPNAFSLDINDPDDAELIEYFLDELPEKIEIITTATTSDDVEALSRIAHQLKGAAPGFGFPTIGEAAGTLEGTLKEVGDSIKDVAKVKSEVDSLLALCQSYIDSNPFA